MQDDNDKVKILTRDPDQIELEEKKRKLEALRTRKDKGSIVRSRAKLVEEGGKPTSYIFNLENRNFTSKIIPKIQKGNGDNITNQNDILFEVQSFYTDLYSYRDVNNMNLDHYLNGCEVPKLINSESERLGYITMDEASNTLKI